MAYVSAAGLKDKDFHQKLFKRMCKRCGEMFQPSSRDSRICPGCYKIPPHWKKRIAAMKGGSSPLKRGPRRPRRELR